MTLLLRRDLDVTPLNVSFNGYTRKNELPEIQAFVDAQKSFAYLICIRFYKCI